MIRPRSVVTIGVFDGVHTGHRAVIKEAVRQAAAKGLKSIVVTFDPHPLKVLNGKKMAPSLISLKHRIELIKGLGIDRVVVVKFDRRIASMPAEKFIKELIIKRLNAGTIVVGEDFCFGKDASSDVRRLRRIAKKYFIDVKAIRHLKKSGRIISSTIIRKLVVEGNIRKASELLGRPFSILGTVVAGARLASSLGYPTANINPHHEAIPPSGVYAVRVKFKSRTYKGVMNIGIRPTFYDYGRDKEPSIEAHIFNFHERVYGHDLEIFFVCRLRAEKKFKTTESLVRQIKKDESMARGVLS